MKASSCTFKKSVCYSLDKFFWKMRITLAYYKKFKRSLHKSNKLKILGLFSITLAAMATIQTLLQT